MMTNGFTRGSAVAVVLLGLAACNGSNGGGIAVGGGPGGAASSDAAFNAAFAAESGGGATASMPTTFSGNFDGQVQAQLRSTGANGAPLGHAVADLALSVNWTDGQTGPAFTGTASNFAGEVDGNATTWTGTLNVDQTPGLNGIQRLPTCGTAPAPVCGTNGTDAAQRIGAVTIPLTGNLQVTGGTAGADSNLLLAGGVSDDQDGLFGATSGTFILPDGTTAVVAGTESGWYVERQ